MAPYIHALSRHAGKMWAYQSRVFPALEGMLLDPAARLSKVGNQGGGGGASFLQLQGTFGVRHTGVIEGTIVP
jgi:hypothetical protein